MYFLFLSYIDTKHSLRNCIRYVIQTRCRRGTVNQFRRQNPNTSGKFVHFFIYFFLSFFRLFWFVYTFVTLSNCPTYWYSWNHLPNHKFWTEGTNNQQSLLAWVQHHQIRLQKYKENKKRSWLFCSANLLRTKVYI